MSRLDRLRCSVADRARAAQATARRRLADSTVGERLAERRRGAAIAASPLFDPEWYLAAHPDLAGVDPLAHYLGHGESEARDPGPDFDARAYEWANPGAAGRALTHFLLHAAPGQHPDHVVDLSQPVLAEGWFDPHWYAARHPELDLDGLDHGSATAVAWRHYRVTGGTPGPYFDRDGFLGRHGVEASSPDPVVAWASRRESSEYPGWVAAVTSTDRRGPLAQPELLPPSKLAEVRVAAAIHAFHLDLLEELLERLVWIPGRLTVLVTTNQMEAIDDIDRRITAVLGDVARTVRFAPNAGRNFGPLLAGLDGDLRQHDVVLHLHTKKSMASGTERSDWRHHLLDGLLPSPAGVQAIVSALAADAPPMTAYEDAIVATEARPIGLLHGVTWPGLPTFANHWLGNRGRGHELFEALGADPADASGWLDYPVGGMFWARVDALRPLLDLSIQYPEFGEELGQLDRTLAHAIERTIPASARTAGFDVVELAPQSGQWRLDWSDRNLGATGDAAACLPQLDAMLADADVVSVDLFDTLLLRPTTDPDGLFDLLTERVGQVDDPAAVVRARRSAEHRLRVHPDPLGDVRLTEIRDEMVAALDVSPGDADRLVEAELQLERDLAIPRTWLIERLREARRRRPELRVLLMTDTTQPAEAIAALVDRIDASDVFDELYVSNDRRARKDSGTLWELVERVEAPERLLHLGDNAMSDLQQACDRGHGWVQIAAPGEIPAMGGVELRRLGPTGVGSRRRATEFLVGHGLAALAQRSDPDRGTGRGVDAAGFGFGVVGPMMTAFANWCLHTARERGAETVVFGGRDGHVAHAVAERIAPHLDDAPTVAYLPLSRRVALGAALARPGGLAAMLDAADWTGSLGDLLRTRAGVELPDELGRRPVRLPEDRDAVLELLAEPDLAAHGQVERDALERALAELAPGDGSVAVVELGYSGTVLRALRTAIDTPLIGLFGVTTARVDDLDDIATCFTTDARLGGGDLIYDRAMPWEILCSRPTEQAARYHLDDSGAATLETVPGTAPHDEVATVVHAVQAAALDFVDAHLERFGPTWLAAPIDTPSVRRAFQTALGRGVPDPTELFAGLTLDDGFRGLDRVTVVID